MKTAATALLSTAVALGSLPSVRSAQVDVAHNSVKARSAEVKAGAPLAPDTPIATGSRSRTQVSLGTSGSLVRAGSKTEAVLHNDTDLSLRQGVMLASSGRRTLGREAVSVQTPEAKATVKGTMLVAYQPKSFIKITCIEGRVTVKLKALAGEFVQLREGQMVIINPAEKRLPDEVEVDLNELSRTCALLGPGFPELGSRTQLERAATVQARGITEGDALRTPLVMNGAGLEVTLELDRGITGRPPPPGPASPPPPVVRRPPPGGGGGPAAPGGPPPATGPEYIIDGTTVFSSGGGDFPIPTLQTAGFPLKQGTSGVERPTLWQFDNLDPSQSPELLIRGSVTIPQNSSYGDSYVADGNLFVGDGGSTRVLLTSPLLLGARQSVVVDSAEILTAPDASSGLEVAADQQADITRSTISQASHVFVSAPSINISQSKLTGESNGVTLHAAAGGRGIVVANSSQLQSLATSVGVSLITQGSPISIRDSRIDGSNVLIDTMGLSGEGGPGATDSLLEIRNATINGDLIRARAFGSNDRDALVINNSTINGAQMIKFYAEGASKLRFQGDVNLNLGRSGQAILAGKTVQVDNGGAVNVSGGGLTVYRDVDNYNKPGFGNINAPNQQSHRPFAERPGF